MRETQLGASLVNRDKTGLKWRSIGAGREQVARFRGELEPGGAVVWMMDRSWPVPGGESGMAGACIIQIIHIYGHS
jgi:hypothetical protein